MNQRILEFAKQAGLKGFFEEDLSPPEKVFVQLIVRECAEFARQHNLEKADRSHLIHRAIKQHFGVEE